MDYDDLDDPFQSNKPKPSRFAPNCPKSSKFQPKAKAGAKVQPPTTKAEPNTELPVIVVKKEDDPVPLSSAAKMDIDEENEIAVKNGGNNKVSEIMEPSNNEDVMEEEDDYVVSEYDFYYCTSDPQIQIYVVQYPLRPSWRPYELEQRCTEVRVKPDSGAMELDLLIDTYSDNYDPKFSDAAKIDKQTLSSSGVLPQVTTYAVAVFSGKKLFVNPMDAITQLRPSMEYLNSGGLKKKINPNSDARAGPSRKQSKQLDPKSVESWISLKYHSSVTELAERYLRNMMLQQNKQLEFSMNPCDYLNSFCPEASNKTKSAGQSRRSLLSLPLEERIKRWLLEGPAIHRFNAIKHLAPEDSDENILEVLQTYALLIQGLWVRKTSIRSEMSGHEALARDYALILFSQNPVIKDEQLNVLGSLKSTGKAVLKELAVERPYCKDWKFKEPTDFAFMKLYPKVVEQQQKLLRDHERNILQKIAKRQSRHSLLNSTQRVPSMPSDEGASKTNNVVPSSSTSMSKETREALHKVLRMLFQTHKACSFQTICQGLGDMAVSISCNPKVDASATDARAVDVMAAAKGVVDAPQEEIQAAISEIAINIHDVYVLRSSSEHPEINPLRNLVIDLFLGSRPKAKLKKGEVLAAAKSRFQKEPTNTEFQKVITELCVSIGGGWVLKTGG